MPHQWIEAPVDPKIQHPPIGKKRWMCTACGKYVGYLAGATPQPEDHVWVSTSVDPKDLRDAVKMTCEEYQAWRVQNQ